MGNSHDRRRIRRLVLAAIEEFKLNFMPPQVQQKEAEMSKKPEIDLGLICGVAAYVLTIAAIFEPVRNWWFIVPVLSTGAVLVVLTIWKYLLSFSFVKTYRKTSFVVVFVLVALGFCGWGWRIRPLISYDPPRLRLISNEGLKEAEKELAKKMREYQGDYDKKDRELSSKTNPYSPQEAYLPIIRLGDEFRTGFYNNYLGKGAAIRDEFLWRLGKTPEQAEQDVFSGLTPGMQYMHPPNGLGRLSRALGGSVSGPEPVSDAALYLDELAKELR